VFEWRDLLVIEWCADVCEDKAATCSFHAFASPFGDWYKTPF